MSSMSEEAAKLLAYLRATEVQPPPAPWRLVISHSIGGLTEVGYAENSDLLLVVSASGRGVFDCITGERVARLVSSSSNDYEWYLGTKLKAFGIGPLEGQLIRLAGIMGGGLLQVTEGGEGWELEHIWHDWPDSCLVLSRSGSSIEDDPKFACKIADNMVCTYRAHGFSETGRSFIYATSCSLDIFSR